VPWIKQTASLSSEETKAALGRWVPEYKAAPAAAEEVRRPAAAEREQALVPRHAEPPALRS
jgi:hypothetical protein